MQEDRNNKKFWDKFAFMYSKFMSRNDYIYDEVCNMARYRLHKDMNVLELACGTGQLSFRLYRSVNKWIATDFSENMIKRAKKRDRSNSIDFHVADATNLLYPDRHFDAVVIANALHIMPQPEMSLREAFRVLKPNGILIAPNFVFEGNFGKYRMWMLERLGFHSFHKWSAEEYVNFVKANNFFVSEAVLIDSSPLVELMLVAIRGD